MRRSYFNLVLDAVLFLGVLWLLMTGLLMAFVLPPGSGGSSVWGWTRHDWGDVHFWTAMVLIGVGVLHVVLHLNWICSVASSAVKLNNRSLNGRTRHVAGAALAAIVVLFVGGFLFWANTAAERQEGGRHQRELASDSDGLGWGAGGGRGGGMRWGRQ